MTWARTVTHDAEVPEVKYCTSANGAVNRASTPVFAYIQTQRHEPKRSASLVPIASKQLSSVLPEPPLLAQIHSKS